LLQQRTRVHGSEARKHFVGGGCHATIPSECGDVKNDLIDSGGIRHGKEETEKGKEAQANQAPARISFAGRLKHQHLVVGLLLTAAPLSSAQNARAVRQAAAHTGAK
jgi:hypothetical protein